MALLRPGRWGSRRQGDCLQHRTEAQRRPKGQDAGGTPALPGDAVPAVRWGAGGRLLTKPTCTLWETPVCPPAVLLPLDRADHSRVKQRIIGRVEGRRAGLRSRESLLPAAFATRRCLNPVLAAFPRPRSSNRTCGFPASGFQSRSCLRPRKALWLRRQASESMGFP